MTGNKAIARAQIRRVREDPRSGPESGKSCLARVTAFPLGRLFATPGALELLADIRDTGRPYSARNAAQPGDPIPLVLPYVRRHALGDWGNVDAEDWSANEEALKAGARLLSAYDLGEGRRLWIITEADRSSTTVLLPEEY